MRLNVSDSGRRNGDQGIPQYIGTAKRICLKKLNHINRNNVNYKKDLLRIMLSTKLYHLLFKFQIIYTSFFSLLTNTIFQSWILYVMHVCFHSILQQIKEQLKEGKPILRMMISKMPFMVFHENTKCNFFSVICNICNMNIFCHSWTLHIYIYIFIFYLVYRIPI